MSWTVEVGRGYTISVYFVEKMSSQDLLHNLKSKGEAICFLIVLFAFLTHVNVDNDSNWGIEVLLC